MEGSGVVGMRIIPEWFTGNHDIRDTRACDAADALRYATGFITLDKTKSVPFTVDRPEINFKKEKTMKTIKDVDRIVITKNDLNEVLLRAYSGDEIVKKTIAKCSPDDFFDFNIGAKLSVDRLYDGYDMTPKAKPKRKPYNGKIFIARYPGFGLRDNALYSVTNGIINGCLFGRDPFIYCDMSDEVLSAAICLNVYGGDHPDDVAKCSAYFVR